MMNNFNLLRNPNFQLNKVSPLDNGTLVTFINNYMYAMIGMFDEFVDHLETKLINLNHRIDNIQANLVILEMKLNSVNNNSTLLLSNDDSNTTLDDNQSNNNQVITAPEMLDMDKINVQKDDIKVDRTETLIDHQTTTTHQQQNNNSISSSEIESSTVSDNNQSVDDENLEIYKRMLRFGVNENAVRQKMLIDGVEPSLLNL